MHMPLGRNFDLSSWNLTLPVDSVGRTGGVASTVKFPSTYSSSFFNQLSSSKIVFTADVAGATTSGSKYARSELREMNGTNLAAWKLAQGGTMTATLTVDEVPILKGGAQGRVVIGQIHGASEELVRLYWENGKVYFANDRAGANNVEMKFQLTDQNGGNPDITLGEKFSYVISAKGDKLVVAVYADGKVYSSETKINSVWQSDSLYFKAGVYLGVNETQGTGKGVVSFDALDYSHTVNSGFDGLVGNAASSLAEVTDYTGWAPAAGTSSGMNDIAGTSANDTIFGTAGDDRIIGNAGSDKMHGGAGDDFYYVDAAGDTVVEKVGEGRDKVFSSVTYTLLDQVEDLKLLGTGDISANGNSAANSISGNDGKNVIDGKAGNDMLYGLAGSDTIYGGTGNDRLFGGDGNDILFGGAGKDAFVFNTILDGAQNVDSLRDFSKIESDKIHLDADIFQNMGDSGQVASKYFALGAVAKTADQHLLYEASSGKLFYDVDGSGGSDAVLFAQLQKNLVISASDFLLF